MPERFRLLFPQLILVWAVCALIACSGSTSSSPPDPKVDSGPADVAVFDQLPSVDLSVPEVVVHDVPVDGPSDVADDDSRCRVNADCASRTGAPVCDTRTGECVRCTADDDACPPAEHCDEPTHTCVPGCHRDEGCRTGGGSLYCNVATRACVACLRSEQCPLNHICVGNACVPGCEPDRGCGANQVCCERSCVDPMNNPMHCGGCGVPCMSGPGGVATCANGQCVLRCDDGRADCNARQDDGCEVDLRASSANCGACGSACAPRPNASSACVMGTCATVCDDGFADCNTRPDDGCETDVRVAMNHCGRCGASCAAGANATATCTMGACRTTCNDGFADCNTRADDGCEADLTSSATHCGGCGMACGAGQVCRDRRCVSPCATGEIECGGRCVNPQTDRANCGVCGRDCAPGTCRAGACTPFLIATLPTSRAVTLAFDGTYLYSGGHFEGTLYRVRADGAGAPQRLYDGPGYLTGVYWLNGTLYWNSYRDSNVYRAPATGGGTVSPAPLGLGDPGDILVEDDFIYAVSYQMGASSPVYRTSRTGGAPMSFATVPDRGGEEIFRAPSGDLLISSQYLDTIWRVSRSGSVSLMVRLSTGASPQQIGADSGALYVCLAGVGQVLRIDNATMRMTPVATGLDSPYGLVVTDTMIYFSNYFAHDIWGMRK